MRLKLPTHFTNPWTGEQWRIRRTANLNLNGEACDGVCDYENHELRINSNQTGRDLLVTLLHEAWHTKGSGNMAHLVRRRLNGVCEDMADILISLGLLK